MLIIQLVTIFKKHLEYWVLKQLRQCIYNEIEEAFEANGNYINYRHLALLCDRMTATKKMVSIFRHGINNDDIGPIAKASFEETPEMFLRARRHGELDLMTGVSSNIMVGQQGHFGTNSFQVILNVQEILNMQSKDIKKDTDIESLLKVENPNDKCSKNNIIINSSEDSHFNVENTGDIDNDYNPGFKKVIILFNYICCVFTIMNKISNNFNDIEEEEKNFFY